MKNDDHGIFSRVTLSHEINFLQESIPDLLTGLSKRENLVPTAYYYDDAGSIIFTKLCEEPSYYLPRAEKEILEKNNLSIVKFFDGVSIVELGSGDCHKTKVLLKEASKHYETLRYYPIDVNDYILEKAGNMLRTEIPNIHIEALLGRYEDAVKYLAKNKEPKIFLFLGSTMAQFSDEMIESFLDMLRGAAKKGDGFLVGFDLHKKPEILSEPYNTPIAHEHQWNALEHINRIFDGNFDTKSIFSEGRWNRAKSRIEMTLTFLEKQDVELKKLNFKKTFQKGEETITHIMRKLEVKTITNIFKQHNMLLEKIWIHEEYQYGLFLFRF